MSTNIIYFSDANDLRPVSTQNGDPSRCSAASLRKAVRLGTPRLHGAGLTESRLRRVLGGAPSYAVRRPAVLKGIRLDFASGNGLSSAWVPARQPGQ